MHYGDNYGVTGEFSLLPSIIGFTFMLGKEGTRTPVPLQIYIPSLWPHVWNGACIFLLWQYSGYL